MGRVASNRLKILFLHVGAELYGSDRMLLNVVGSVDSSTWEPIVYLPETGPLFDTLQTMGIEVQVLPYPLLRRGQLSLHGLVSYVLRLIVSIIRLSNIVRKRQISVVYSNTIAVLPGLFVAALCRRVSVWHVHEIIKSPKWFTPVMRKLASLTHSHLVYVSHAVKREFEGAYESLFNSHVIYNTASDPGKNRTRVSKNDRLTIGMVGRVNHWKGQDTFVDMASILLNKYDNLRFIMVGGAFKGQEHHFNSLSKKVSEMPGEVVLHGFSKNVGHLVEKFDIMVVPSKLPEPFGLVALEGMLHSIPIIASRSGGLVEIVEDSVTGFLVEPGDASGFAARVEQLLLDPKLMVEMGMLGRKRARTMFSPDIFRRQINELLTSVVQSRA